MSNKPNHTEDASDSVGLFIMAGRICDASKDQYERINRLIETAEKLARNPNFHGSASQFLVTAALQAPGREQTENAVLALGAVLREAGNANPQKAILICEDALSYLETCKGNQKAHNLLKNFLTATVESVAKKSTPRQAQQTACP